MALRAKLKVEHLMKLTINGESGEHADGLTVSALLAERGLDPRRVAVERNKDIVRRAKFDKTCLADDDVIEIVTLVGGG